MSIAEKDVDYKLVLDKKDFVSLLDQIAASSSFSISLETIGDHFLDQKILGIAICIQMGKAFYIPFLHDYDDVPASSIARMPESIKANTGKPIGHKSRV